MHFSLFLFCLKNYCVAFLNNISSNTVACLRSLVVLPGISFIYLLGLSCLFNYLSRPF